MEEKNNKKTYVFISIGVIVAIVITLGLTYAYWRLTKEQTGVNVVNTDCFSIDFTGENDITLDKAYPLDDVELERFLGSATPYHFTITNECSSLASVSINLESLNANADKQLADEWIDAILYETDYHKKLNKSAKLTGNPNNDDNKVIKDAIHSYSLKSFTLKANEKKEYNLLLYLDQQIPLSEETMNASWNGKITLSAEYKEDKFINSGTLRKIDTQISEDGEYIENYDESGMWQYRDNIKKIVIEPIIREKVASENEVLYGPFDEGIEDKPVKSYVICNKSNRDCIGYLQGEGGIKLNLDSTGLFASFSYLEEIEGMEYLDTSEVINMSYMFSGLSHLTKLDLSHFDTSNVTNMSGMFSYLDNNFDLYTLNLNNFDTSKVTNMSYMFHFSNTLTELDLSNFDTSSVTNMDSMFYCNKGINDLDLSTFDTSNVKTMKSFFTHSGCADPGDEPGDDLEIISMPLLNEFGHEGLNISNFDLRNLESNSFSIEMDVVIAKNIIFPADSSNFFKDSGIYFIDLTGANTSNVTNMSYMFSGLSDLQELDLSSFDTSKVIDMRYMFCDSYILNEITYGPNFVHNVEADTTNMFWACSVNKPDPSVLPSWEGVSLD